MESLLLFRRALSSPTMCRFIPALSVPKPLSRNPCPETLNPCPETLCPETLRNPSRNPHAKNPSSDCPRRFCPMIISIPYPKVSRNPAADPQPLSDRCRDTYRCCPVIGYPAAKHLPRCGNESWRAVAGGLRFPRLVRGVGHPIVSSHCRPKAQGSRQKGFSTARFISRTLHRLIRRPPFAGSRRALVAFLEECGVELGPQQWNACF